MFPLFQVSLLKLTQGKTLKRLYETKHMIQVLTSVTYGKVLRFRLKLDCHFQDMLVPIADLKASIELFHREVICHQSAFLALCVFLKPDFNLVCNILRLYFAGGNLPNMALSLQAAFSPRHAQASHQ